MGKVKKSNEDKMVFKTSEIPLESNLGLLAYGDIAFTAWREIKKAAKSEGNNEKK